MKQFAQAVIYRSLEKAQIVAKTDKLESLVDASPDGGDILVGNTSRFTGPVPSSSSI